MNDEARRHCVEIDRCNQRGGRMLSIVDLMDAGTVTPELAAYSLAAIGGGASLLVGAVPGGAGKTTVMGALLNFVPPDAQLAAADGMAAIRLGAEAPRPRRCYICHEIGRGPYYAYLWGPELRAYFDLPAAGHMLATNLHADTYQQARRQICDDNDVTAEALCRMSLMYFMSVRRSGLGARRRIETVWESDGAQPHRQVFAADSPAPLAESALVSAEGVARARATIEKLLADGARTIEQVRATICGPTD
ncbi:MAG: hypothetical protein WBF17_01625 [Phycisphaerae bacterium]